MDADRDDLNTEEPLTAGEGPDGRLTPNATEGVLGSLPRTRPQRASPRRTAQAKAKRAGDGGATEAKAKRTGAGRAQETKPKRANGTGTARAKPKRDAAKEAAVKAKPERRPRAKTAPSHPASAAPARPKAPRQGYEPEEEPQVGRSVHPPGAIELVESVADIVLELASASLKSGGRVLRDALSPLRRS